jgi:hypothetical protein
MSIEQSFWCICSNYISTLPCTFSKPYTVQQICVWYSVIFGNSRCANDLPICCQILFRMEMFFLVLSHEITAFNCCCDWSNWDGAKPHISHAARNQCLLQPAVSHLVHIMFTAIFYSYNSERWRKVVTRMAQEFQSLNTITQRNQNLHCIVTDVHEHIVVVPSSMLDI